MTDMTSITQMYILRCQLAAETYMREDNAARDRHDWNARAVAQVKHQTAQDAAWAQANAEKAALEAANV